MKDCIDIKVADKLRQAIENGDVSIDSIKKMESKDRGDLFREYLGEKMGTKMNIGFEQRMNSEAKDILKKYIERELTRVPATSRKVLLNRLSKMENLINQEEGRPFLNELVSHKLGVQVTEDEAKTLINLANVAKKAKDKIPAEIISKGLKGTDEQLEYGYAEVAVIDYMSDIQRTRAGRNWSDITAQKTMSKKWEQFARTNYNIIVDGIGALKGIVASLDNSFFGRQGIKMLAYKPEIWVKNFIKSWFDLGESLLKSGYKPVSGETGVRLWGERNAVAFDRMRAEILSRPNALNGTYDRAANGFGLRLGTEEDFPINLGEKIPLFGRVYKASEVAFNGAALRMRADLADAMIETFKKNKVDITDKEIIDELGRFVSSMTGRGDLRKFESAAGPLGTIMFSARFFKSQIDSFTALPKFLMQPTNPVRQQYAQAMARTIAMWGVILGLGQYFGIADVNPKSDKFGTLKLGNSTFDITGGHASMTKLLARLFTGERIDPKTGVTKSVDTFGSDRDALVWSFLSGKFAPFPALVRDMIKGEHFGGEEINGASIAKQLFVPITLTSAFEAGATKDLSEAFLVIMAEGLGFSTADFKYNPIGAGWKELRNGDKTLYNQATNELWQSIYPEIVKARSSASYQKLSEEEKTKFMEKLERRMKERIINQSKYQKVIDAQSTQEVK